MTGIAVELIFLRAEIGVEAVRHAAGHVQELPLARSLIVGHRRLEHMARHIHLVVIPQVGEALVQPLDDVIRVQVAIGLLGLLRQVNGGIGGLFQFGIGMGGQGITHALQPLPQVGILEPPAVELALLQPGGDLKILDAMAGRHAGDAVVKGIPHIGNGYVAGSIDAVGEKRIGDPDILQRK